MTPRQEELLNIICAGVHAARLAAEELHASIDFRKNLAARLWAEDIALDLKGIADEPTLAGASGDVASIEADLRAPRNEDAESEAAAKVAP